MIDWENERVIPLREVPKHVKSRMSGKRLSVATAWRWALRRSNPLETFSTPGGRFTSLEALGRFFEQCSGERTLGAQHLPQVPLKPSGKAVDAGKQLERLIGGKDRAA